MHIGDIYNFKGTTCKILMLDNKEVFYDVIATNEERTFAKARTAIYYRTSVDFFASCARFLAHSTFTEHQLAIYRPDLPLRLNCFKSIFWAYEDIPNYDEFIALLHSHGIQENMLEGLQANKIVIFPMSQQGSCKMPAVIESRKGYFAGGELLLRCFDIQKQYIKMQKQYFSRFRLIAGGKEEKRLTGIGIYRVGIKSNTPSYYLGGFISMAELESDKTLIV